MLSELCLLSLSKARNRGLPVDKHDDKREIKSTDNEKQGKEDEEAIFLFNEICASTVKRCF